jgi:hypothetical protein
MSSEDVLNSIAGQALATSIDKHGIGRLAVAFLQPVTERQHDFFGQRDATRLASLARATHMGAGFQNDILATESDQL